jgi:translation initiation factor IF-3
LLDSIVVQVQDIAQADGLPRMEGRNMSILLTPR